MSFIIIYSLHVLFISALRLQSHAMLYSHSPRKIVFLPSSYIHARAYASFCSQHQEHVSCFISGRVERVCQRELFITIFLKLNVAVTLVCSVLVGYLLLLFAPKQRTRWFFHCTIVQNAYIMSTIVIYNKTKFSCFTCAHVLTTKSP